MPFIDTVKRITTEEFKPEDREVAERIGNVYNFFAEQVTNVLNGNIDSENLGRPILSLEISTDSTGKPTQKTQFTSKVGLKGISIIKAVNLTNEVNYLNSHPFISYTANGAGVYEIKNLTGLIASQKYQITFELIF